MKYSFESIMYWHNSNGIITILFKNPVAKEMLVFDGAVFKKSSDCQQMSNLEEYKFKTGFNIHEIIEIRQTEDFDYIILLNENVYLKIFYTPNDKYENGVIQSFIVYYPSDIFHQEIQIIFNESEQLSII